MGAGSVENIGGKAAVTTDTESDGKVVGGGERRRMWWQKAKGERCSRQLGKGERSGRQENLARWQKAEAGRKKRWLEVRKDQDGRRRWWWWKENGQEKCTKKEKDMNERVREKGSGWGGGELEEECDDQWRSFPASFLWVLLVVSNSQTKNPSVVGCH